jgi:hypothetical protein
VDERRPVESGLVKFRGTVVGLSFIADFLRFPISQEYILPKVSSIGFAGAFGLHAHDGAHAVPGAALDGLQVVGSAVNIPEIVDSFEMRFVASGFPSFPPGFL